MPLDNSNAIIYSYAIPNNLWYSFLDIENSVSPSSSRKEVTSLHNLAARNELESVHNLARKLRFTQGMDHYPQLIMYPIMYPIKLYFN